MCLKFQQKESTNVYLVALCVNMYELWHFDGRTDNYIPTIYCTMLETTSNLSMLEQQSEVSIPKQQSSLPLIARKIYLDQVNTNSREHRPPLVLPNINKNRRSTESPTSVTTNNNKQEFSRAVKRKLEIVLGEMPELNNGQKGENSSDDEDFQQKVNRNREMIKRHRLNKEKYEQLSPANKKSPSPDIRRKIDKKMRNESVSLKKQQAQNIEFKKRNLTKKVYDAKYQIIYSQSPSLVGESQKQIKPKEVFKSIKIGRDRSNERNVKNKIVRAKSFNKQKNLIEINKPQNLFDGIQNILENPHKQEVTKGPVGLTLIKAKRDLEDKIKVLDEKLGITESQDKQRMLMQSLDLNSSGKHWRKIRIKAHNVESQGSTFEEEVERIKKFQERNSITFENYLEYQKMLLELQTRHRSPARDQHTSS